MATITRLALFCILAARAEGVLRRRISNESAQVNATPPTFIFFAGLEGTGHHVFAPVMNACIEAGRCGMLSKPFYTAASRYSIMRNPEEMLKAWAAEDVEENVVYPLNPLMDGNMMSYPTKGPHHNPHMHEFYKAAQHFGYLFKVVVMLRNPRDIMRSDAGRWSHTEDDMLAALEKLSMQLRNLPADMHMCVVFEKLGNIGPEFQEFLGVKNFSVGAALHQLFTPSPGCGAVNCSAAPRLAEADAEFRKEFCPTAAQPLAAGVSQPLAAGVSQPLAAGVSQPLAAGVSKPLAAGVSKVA